MLFLWVREFIERGTNMRDQNRSKPRVYRYENELYRNSFSGNMIISITFSFFAGIFLGLGYLLRNLKMADWFLYFIGVVIGCIALVFFCKGICNKLFKRKPKAYLIMSAAAIPPTVVLAYAYLSKI